MKSRIALVTGASRGIGRGIAYALAGEGWKVGVNYAKDAEGAEETAEGVRERGGQAVVLQADVGSAAEVNRMFDALVEEWGVPNALVGNAGIQTWKPILELTEDEWDRTIRTNLKGAFLCLQRAAREMSAIGEGRIVNIGAGCNKSPFPNLADYTASKGGLEMLTRVAAVELGPLGITVNCVAPGAVEIERTRNEASGYDGAWAPLTPLRRVGDVEDVAAAVLFLLSDRASFINGQTLYVDGGLFTQVPWPYEIR